MRGCDVEGCERIHRAKGLCSTHYNQQMSAAKRHPKVTMRCAWCDAEVEKDAGRNGRYVNVFCGLPCRDAFCSVSARATSQWQPPAPSRRLPARHPAMAMQRHTPAPRLFVSGTCHECDTPFTVYDPSRSASYCSDRCSRRTVRRTRKARARRAEGSFRLLDVVRILRLNGRCCAYCDQPVPGLPDPDHVIPLSRGGSNDLSNILPSCRECNRDKGELTPSEWARERARLGKQARRTEFSSDDIRWRHLMLQPAATESHRSRLAA